MGKKLELPPAWLQQLVRLPYREAKRRVLDAFDTAYFEEQLALASGNRSEAARRADMDVPNFRRKLRGL